MSQPNSSRLCAETPYFASSFLRRYSISMWVNSAPSLRGTNTTPHKPLAGSTERLSATSVCTIPRYDCTPRSTYARCEVSHEHLPNSYRSIVKGEKCDAVQFTAGTPIG